MDKEKEVDIRFEIGDIDNAVPGHEFTLSVVTGPTKTNKLLNELQVKYKEDFDKRVTAIAFSEDPEQLKKYLDEIEKSFDEDKDYYTIREVESFKNEFKPKVKVVGTEVVGFFEKKIDPEETEEEIKDIVDSFKSVLKGSDQLKASIKVDKTIKEITKEKKNLFYSLCNGVTGHINLKLTLPTLEKFLEIQQKQDPYLNDEVAKMQKSSLNIFKRWKFSIKMSDAGKMPREIQDIFEHPVIEQVFNPFSKIDE